MYRCTALLTALTFVPLCGLCQSQIDPMRVYGAHDSYLPTPQPPTRQAQDSGAIQALIEFIQATHLRGWQGVDATGTVTFASDPAPHPAHLRISGSAFLRLDIETADGQRRIIISSNRAVQQATSGTQTSLSSDIALGSFLALPRILSNDYPLPTSTVLDNGSVTTADGHTLRRISMTDIAPGDTLGSTQKTADFLFDPQTHYLSAVTSLARVSTQDPSAYFVETDFADYSETSGELFPMRLTQSLNGQLQWTLDLATVQLAATPDQTIFSF